MFTVIKTFVRPNAETDFFRAQLQYVQQLIFDLQITKQEVLSEDLLTQTITLTAPSQQVFLELVQDAVFENNYNVPLNEYNLANGITSIVNTSEA